MKFTNLFLATIVSTALNLSISSMSALMAAEDAGQLAQQGLKALQAKNYKEAQNYLTQAATLNSREPSYQYYLSLAAYQAGDKKAGKAALSRLFLTQTQYSKYMNPARELHKKYGNNMKDSRSYYAAKDGMITTWHRRQMPLKIYISNGLTLPSPYGTKFLNLQELSELQEWIKKPGAVASLKTCSGYQPGYASQVRSALGEWSFANQERIITYQVVNNPVGANIMVFWAPKFVNSDRGGQTEYSVHPGETRPVIIKLRVDYSPLPSSNFSQYVRNAAAHELGHALGIQSHSNLGGDLMGPTQNFQKGAISHISENDKETLRALYSVAPHQNF